MITVIKVGGHNNIKSSQLAGLSTDEKPLTEPNGSTFYEMDTQITYFYDSQHGIWIAADSGGGHSGNKDYDNLDNKPIINKHGIIPIDLNSLKMGLYSMTGNYKYNDSGETQTFSGPTLVQVSEQESGKIIHFEFDENLNHYYRDIVYTPDGEFKIKTHLFNEEILDKLPLTGEPTKIYTTPEGMFVWDGAQFKKLGADSIWESF